jgi:hypothetical protein
MEQQLLLPISIGDPAIGTGAGNLMFFYGGIVAGIAGSLLLWWYFARKNRHSR